MNKKGQLIVVSGPSGVGKGTVLKEYLNSRDGIAYSVSATTRQPRPGEENGIHYYFLSREEFERTAAEGGMLEYASYNGNYYGTPKAPVEQQRNQGYGQKSGVQLLPERAKVKLLHSSSSVPR